MFAVWQVDFYELTPGGRTVAQDYSTSPVIAMLQEVVAIESVNPDLPGGRNG